MAQGGETTRNKLHGLFVSYDEPHFRKAFGAFEEFMLRLDADSTITVVNNNPVNHIVDSVPGDNRIWEFTGWDCGLARIEDLKENDVVIFCNDTFANNRHWGRGDQRRFTRAMRTLLSSKQQGMSGEIHSYGQPFEILGLRHDAWVSTYLFAMTGGLLSRLGRKISLAELDLQRMARGVGETGVLWGSGISAGLKKHLDEWLFPHRPGTGWYKSRSVSAEIKLQKLRTILNEKYLAAWCVAQGGIVVDAGPGYLLRKTREIKSRYLTRPLLER